MQGLDIFFLQNIFARTCTFKFYLNRFSYYFFLFEEFLLLLQLISLDHFQTKLVNFSVILTCQFVTRVHQLKIWLLWSLMEFLYMIESCFKCAFLIYIYTNMKHVERRYPLMLMMNGGLKKREASNLINIQIMEMLAMVLVPIGFALKGRICRIHFCFFFF